jgi:hypothetical protein
MVIELVKGQWSVAKVLRAKTYQFLLTADCYLVSLFDFFMNRVLVAMRAELIQF